MSLLHCLVPPIPPFHTISMDGGAATSIATSTPWDFAALVTAIHTVMNANGYTCVLGATGVLTVTKTGGTDHTWTVSASTAQLLGWDSTTKGPATFTSTPIGCVRLLEWRTESSSSSPVERRKYGRFGQRVTTAPTVAPRKELRVTLGMSAADAHTFATTGMCRAFRALNTTYAVVDLGALRGADTVEGYVRVEATVTPLAGAPPALACGYAWAYYARIEGIPHVFSELATGWTDADGRTEEARLWMDPSAVIEHTISRSESLMGASSMVLGVNDPENALELFGDPQLVSVLTGDWDETSTEVSVDATGSWPSSGALYIGKEYVAYGGKTSTKFQTLTREDFNPLYRYSPDTGTAPFATVADRPVVWRGRVVEVWRYAVDPLGRPVGSAWDAASDYPEVQCQQVYLGEVVSVPRYVEGVWELSLQALVRRLEGKVGSEAEGQLAGLTPQLDVPVAVHVDDRVVVRVVFDDGTEDSVEYNPFADFSSDVLASDASWKVVKLGPLVGAICGSAWGLVDGSGDSVQSLFPAYCNTAAYDPGTSTVVLKMDAFGLFSELKQVIWHLSSYNLTTSGPYWLGGWEFDANNYPDGFFGGKIRWDQVSHTGKSSRCVVLTAPPATMGGALPSSGLLVLEGQEQEVVRYEAALAGATTGLTFLVGVTRGLYGSAVTDVYAGGTYSAATEFTGGYGEQLATMLQSSGIGDRGTYDTASESAGYGLPSTWVSDSGWSEIGYTSPTLVTGAKSLAEVYGGLLRLLGYCIGVRRSGRRLVLGLVPVEVPTGDTGTAEVIAGGDLRRGSPMQPGEASRPNIVRLEALEVPGAKDSPTITLIAGDSVRARGGEEATFAIPLDVTGPLAQVMAASIIWSAERSVGLVEVELADAPVAPMVGREVLLQAPDSAIWDYAADAPLSAATVRAWVVSERRPVSGGHVRLTLRIRGQNAGAGYCDHAQVSAATSTSITVPRTGSVFTTAAAALAAGLSSFGLRIYHAGVAGRVEDVSVTAANASTGELTLSTTVSSWVTSEAGGAYLYATWRPSGDYGSNAYELAAVGDVHLSDGTTWS